MQAVYITKRGSYNWIKNLPVKPTYCEMPCRHACKCQDLEQKYNEEIKLAKANSIPFEIQIAAESLIADNDDWCLDDISVIKQPISIHSIWVANTEGIVGNPEIYKEDRMMVARIVPYKVFGEPFETDIAEKHVNESENDKKEAIDSLIDAFEPLSVEDDLETMLYKIKLNRSIIQRIKDIRSTDKDFFLNARVFHFKR